MVPYWLMSARETNAYTPRVMNISHQLGEWILRSYFVAVCGPKYTLLCQIFRDMSCICNVKIFAIVKNCATEIYFGSKILKGHQNLEPKS